MSFTFGHTRPGILRTKYTSPPLLFTNLYIMLLHLRQPGEKPSPPNTHKPCSPCLFSLLYNRQSFFFSFCWWGHFSFQSFFFFLSIFGSSVIPAHIKDLEVRPQFFYQIFVCVLISQTCLPKDGCWFSFPLIFPKGSHLFLFLFFFICYLLTESVSLFLVLTIFYSKVNRDLNSLKKKRPKNEKFQFILCVFDLTRQLRRDILSLMLYTLIA